MTLPMDLEIENSFNSVTRPKNLSSQIEDQLLDSIKKGVFPVGSLLPSESKLVEIFNVSRGVIRESLLLLSAKSIIEIHKGKGAVVINPSMELLFDPFSSFVNFKCGNKGLKCALETRIMIEPQIASIAAKLRTEENLIKLKYCFHKMKKFVNDKRLFNYHDVEFHKTISLSSGNPMFSIILEPIFHFMQSYHLDTFLDLNENEFTLDFHNRIYLAIEKKKSDEVFSLMSDHLTSGLNGLIKNLADSPE